MSTTLDLKQIERKAFRSTYQDGLWDMYLGAVVAAMAIFMYRPEEGYAPINILMAVVIITLAYGLFKAGKKSITFPADGQVRFGPVRQQKKKTLAAILGIVVLLQAGLVGLTIIGWANPVLGVNLFGFLGGANNERLAVAAVASLFVGPTMMIIAFFNDFLRGIYIALMMALAVFLMILINQPLYPIFIGGLIFLPGLVLFIRFLRQYPVPQGDETHG